MPTARGECAEFRCGTFEIELIPGETIGGGLWNREMSGLALWRSDGSLLAVGGAADEGDGGEWLGPLGEG